MSLVISAVIETLVEMTFEGALKRGQQNEAIIKVKDKLGLRGAPEPEFNSVYIHTLINYGVGRPQPVLEFFQLKNVRNTFEQAFNSRNPDLIEQEIEPFLQNYEAGRELRRKEIRLKEEVAKFEKEFYRTIDLTRAPAEVRRDHTLEDIREDLQVIQISNEKIESELKRERQRIIEAAGERQSANAGQKIVGLRYLDTTSFLNRKAFCKRLSELIASPETRIVSIIGTGGIGKSAIAAKLVDSLEDDDWFHTDQKIPVDGIVMLSTETNGITLERLFLGCAELFGGERKDAILSVWAKPRLDIKSKINRLLSEFKEGIYIFLFDNFEELLDEQQRIIDEGLRIFFEMSLVTSHNARLIITSREPVDFGEPTGLDKHISIDRGLPKEYAVKMLKQLDPNGYCGIRDADPSRLEECVQLVHGIPRALELIASILSPDVADDEGAFLTLEELLEKKHIFKHKKFVEELVAENYKRLSSGEHKLLGAIAVFGRPVPMLAIDYLVKSFAPELATRQLLIKLVRRHTASIDRSEKLVFLHPIDRDFAYSQIPNTETGKYNRKALHKRASSYYAQLRIPEQMQESRNDLEAELREIDHLIKAAEYDRAAQVLNSIGPRLIQWGHTDVVEERRLELIDKLSDQTLVSDNYISLGDVYWSRRLYDQAAQYYERSLETIDSDDITSKSKVYSQLGLVYINLLDDYEKAFDILLQALLFSQDVKDRERESSSLAMLGYLYSQRVQYEKAVEFYHRAITISRAEGFQRNEGIQLGGLGFLYYRLGEFVKAQQFHEDALDIAKKLNDRRYECIRLNDLGNVHSALGEHDKALEYFSKALQVATETNQIGGQSKSLIRSAKTHILLRDFEQANDNLSRAAALVAGGSKRDELTVNMLTARLCLHTKQLSQSKERISSVVGKQNFRELDEAFMLNGLIQLHLGRRDKAASSFQQSIELADSWLRKSPGYFPAKFSRAVSFSGLAMTSSSGQKRAPYVQQAKDAYKKAVRDCSALGVMDDTRSLLNEIIALDEEKMLEEIAAILPKSDSSVT